jgi:hypothetical protein
MSVFHEYIYKSCNILLSLSLSLSLSLITLTMYKSLAKRRFCYRQWKLWAGHLSSCNLKEWSSNVMTDFICTSFCNLKRERLCTRSVCISAWCIHLEQCNTHSTRFNSQYIDAAMMWHYHWCSHELATHMKKILFSYTYGVTIGDWKC